MIVQNHKLPAQTGPTRLQLAVGMMGAEIAVVSATRLGKAQTYDSAALTTAFPSTGSELAMQLGLSSEGHPGGQKTGFNCGRSGPRNTRHRPESRPHHRPGQHDKENTDAYSAG